MPTLIVIFERHSRTPHPATPQTQLITSPTLISYTADGVSPPSYARGEGKGFRMDLVSKPKAKGKSLPQLAVQTAFCFQYRPQNKLL